MGVFVIEKRIDHSRSSDRGEALKTVRTCSCGVT
jgi:hypothetical protein